MTTVNPVGTVTSSTSSYNTEAAGSGSPEPRSNNLAGGTGNGATGVAAEQNTQNRLLGGDEGGFDIGGVINTVAEVAKGILGFVLKLTGSNDGLNTPVGDAIDNGANTANGVIDTVTSVVGTVINVVTGIFDFFGGLFGKDKEEGEASTSASAA
ncbi:hypothetical protein CS022_08705 [Veronia nyctiphanis]|uniref:Uncharacterized protein n=1 Tax=Veronia nyctiphanis TaxID=1278244 RepID=A0A4Q0YSD1_9GAMM|nr:hypothetical protein [Veronia nyctiphanis]RXJ73573.1 hypothetical protein CS022_08705 [Veronia nyctiphanis]